MPLDDEYGSIDGKNDDHEMAEEPNEHATKEDVVGAEARETRRAGEVDVLALGVEA